MLYADGSTVPECSAEVKKLRIPGNDRNNDKKLNAFLVANDDSFLELWKLWIRPWIEYMKLYDEDEDMELFQKPIIFYENENATLENCNKLIQKFKKVIKTKSSGRQAIWQLCPMEEIFEQIDMELSKVPAYIQLRVKIICMIVSAIPEQAFAEEKRWNEPFLDKFFSDGGESDFYEISNGMEFFLKFEKGEEDFCPRTLYNPTDNPCYIQIKYNEQIWSIGLPAKHSLRVVFGNKKCEYIVSIKGNISFNPNNERSAIVQQVEPEQTILHIYMLQSNEWDILETNGQFMDATVDGEGGATVLTNQGLYNTSWDKITKLEKLPMRIYGAGNFYARHYSDGSLESNLNSDKKSFQNAIAVVEKGTSALLIRDEFGAWECENRRAKKISDEEFVQCMLERFLQGVCEKTSSELMTIAINQDGTKFP